MRKISCEHLDWDNKHDCTKEAVVMCMCCGAGVCQEHTERQCPYGGMGYIDIEVKAPKRKAKAPKTLEQYKSGKDGE